jgi:hypothetical protein
LFGSLWSDYAAGFDSTELASLKFYREDGHGASDHASFLRGGAPTLAFWSRGDHPFYHSYEDDARWISDSVMAVVGHRAEQFIRFLGNHDGPQAFHADSLRLMARLATTVDFGGFTLDGPITIPELSAISAMWLPHDGAAAWPELIRRAADLQSVCAARKIACGSVKESVKAYRGLQNAVFMGISDTDIGLRKGSEVSALARQGISLIKLRAGGAAADLATQRALDAARDAGFWALVPLDFNTPARVDRWGKQALVSGTLKDFAASPATIRDGLLNSAALLCLEVSETPTPPQLDAVRAGAARRLHLSFGSLPLHRREEHAKAVIAALFAGGFTRDEILLLTGGNLRRFFE